MYQQEDASKETKKRDISLKVEAKMLSEEVKR